MSDSEQCSNRLELDLISLLVNFSCELGQRMTRYDFLWARWVILSNVRTDLNFTLLCPPKGGHIVFVRVNARREAWGVRREAWGVRREASAAHLVRSFKEKVIEISSQNFFYMSMVSIAWLLLIFSNFWKTRWPPQPFFLLTQNIDDVRSIKGKVMNISPPYVLYGYKVA